MDGPSFCYATFLYFLFFPICNHLAAFPSVYRSVFFLLSPLCGGKHSLGCCLASVRVCWPSWSCCASPGIAARQAAGLGWAPTHQWSSVTLQGAFVEGAASDKKVLVLFEQLVWRQPAEMGEGSFWPCLLERLNLQRMCWVLTPHGLCECSMFFWTLAFSIRVKYIVCYYHTVKLIFTVLCMIYLRFHWTKQASGIEVL